MSSDSIEQNNSESAGFQAQVNAGGQANQAAQNINQITSSAYGSANQSINEIKDGVVVYNNSGIILIQSPKPLHSENNEPEKVIGPNPYKGLLAFTEKESALYFGRNHEIKTLWNRFRELHEYEDETRILPIYGPSGCGKSSLARAGLIPELGKHPLAGKDRARIAVMVPGTQPIDALARILARIIEQDSMAVRKAREFSEELARVNNNGMFDGLHRIASMLTDIQTFPLIVLIDQFEEIYSLCESDEIRQAFIDNLLYASKEKSEYVSVIISLRSDFLSEVQNHSELNQIFSRSGFLTPKMSDSALREAIQFPAQASNYSFDEATIQLLIEQTTGRAGALPLLQFTLQQIWEKIHSENVVPAEILKEMGGVGGTLANEAQRIYEGLDSSEQEITKHIFVNLVQLGEGVTDTRRRVALAKLVFKGTSKSKITKVIQHFASPKHRLLTVSGQSNDLLIELSHESIMEHWPLLHSLIEKGRDRIQVYRRLEILASEWDERGRNTDILIQGKTLVDGLRYKASDTKYEISQLVDDFLDASRRYKYRRMLQRGWGFILLPAVLFTFEYYLREKSVKEYRENLSISKISTKYQTVHHLTRGCQKISRWNTANRRIGERLFGNCRSLEGETGLIGVDFSEFNLINIHMSRANLTDASFVKAQLSGANLEHALLSSANFQNSYLEQSILSYAELSSTDFSEAELIDAQLVGANLESANFTNANLSGADLGGARVKDADFSGAILKRTKLFDTDLRDSKGLTSQQLEAGEDASLLCNTKLPSNIEVSPDRDCSSID